MGVRVVTANIQANMSLRATLADVRRLLRTKPDVLNFQEIGGAKRARGMRLLLAVAGFAWVQFHGQNRESVPMAYRRRRFRLIKKGAWKLSDAEAVGKAGAGPAVLREKHATYVVLEDKRKPHVLRLFSDSHLAPSIYLPRRAALHAQQVANLAQLADRYRDIRRYCSGDFNTESPRRLHPLMAVGLRMGTDVVTHGRHSCIDRILSDQRGEFSAITGLNSDHNGLLGVFDD